MSEPAPGSEKGWDVGENGWSVEVVRRAVVLVHRRDVLLVDVALAELGDALLEQLLLVSEAEVHVALLSVGTML